MRITQRGILPQAAVLNVYVPFHYVDAAKYVTEINQPELGKDGQF